MNPIAPSHSAPTIQKNILASRADTLQIDTWSCSRGVGDGSILYSHLTICPRRHNLQVLDSGRCREVPIADGNPNVRGNTTMDRPPCAMADWWPDCTSTPASTRILWTTDRATDLLASVRAAARRNHAPRARRRGGARSNLATRPGIRHGPDHGLADGLRHGPRHGPAHGLPPCAPRSRG